MKKLAFLGLGLLILSGCGMEDSQEVLESKTEVSQNQFVEKNDEKEKDEIHFHKEDSKEEDEAEEKSENEEIKEGTNVIQREDENITQIKKLNQSGQSTTLGNGTWKVGRDIKPGHYMLTTQEGSGNISTDGSDHDIDVNIILASQAEAAEETNYLTQYETYLYEGAEIEISDLSSVQFTAIRKGKDINKGTLCAGDYMVGLDIKPGRYKIKAIQGSGNLSSDKGTVNEIFGLEEGDIKETTQNLKAGEMLSTDVNYFSITPVK